MRLTHRLGAAALAVVVGAIGLTVTPASASAAAAIVCQVQVDRPHHSRTVLGTVNVHARVQCTGRTASITLVVSLFRNGVLVGTSGPVTGPGASRVETNAATPCVNGTYQGRAGAIIIFPPGGVPADETRVVASDSLVLVCA